jgi:CTP:molybdopterin cytidylyltransferase MocA
MARHADKSWNSALRDDPATYAWTVQAAVAGVLLAAGEGSRFGQPKALVELDGQTLAERGVELLRAGGADPILVVTGAGRIQLGGTQTVYNQEWRTGMGSSLRAALQALTGTAVGAAVVALADQPLVGPLAVARLIAAYLDGASVAVAAYDGQPRNPVLLAREHWPEVIAMATGDTGARPFLRAHADLVTLVECGDTGRPDDIDTPADLARITDQHRESLPGRARHAPTMASPPMRENLRLLRPHVARAAAIRPHAPPVAARRLPGSRLLMGRANPYPGPAAADLAAGMRIGEDRRGMVRPQALQLEHRPTLPRWCPSP